MQEEAPYRIKWTLVHEHSTNRTYVSAVPGGWLYRQECDGDGPITTVALQFVPDTGEWVEATEEESH